MRPKLALLLGTTSLLLLGLLSGQTERVMDLAQHNRYAVDVLNAVASKSYGNVHTTATQPSGADERLTALVALDQGDVRAADAAFAAALGRDSSQLALVRASRPTDSALAQFAYQHYPKSVDAIDWMADAIRSNEPDKALQLYEEAAAYDPGNNLIWEKVASLALHQQQMTVALDASRRACDINRQRNGMCQEAARLSYAGGEWEQVITYFERGGLPEQAADWVLLIRATQKLERPEAAAQYLHQAQLRNPADYQRLLQAAP